MYGLGREGSAAAADTAVLHVYTGGCSVGWCDFRGVDVWASGDGCSGFFCSLGRDMAVRRLFRAAFFRPNMGGLHHGWETSVLYHCCACSVLGGLRCALMSCACHISPWRTAVSVCPRTARGVLDTKSRTSSMELWCLSCFALRGMHRLCGARWNGAYD